MHICTANLKCFHDKNWLISDIFPKKIGENFTQILYALVFP